MVKRLIWFLNAAVLLLPILTFAQSRNPSIEDSSTQMEEVFLTTFRPESVYKSSLNITAIDIAKNQSKGAMTLTEAITKTPGITALSTGIGISKPVIRGASGNRVLTLLNGLKFDNQQWQEEHGLGLSDLGVGRIEIIKGPMSVLFGSEALAGVVNIIDETKLPNLGHQWNGLLKLHSNTGGFQLQVGYKTNTGKRWSRISLGYENHADYADGNGHRVLNSRFEGAALKYSVGKEKRFHGKPWIQENAWASSAYRFGFIFNDIYTFISPDNRWSRSFAKNPCHIVFVNNFSSQNTVKINADKILNLNFGAQSNERLENEGGGQISINMHLLTLQYLAKYDQKIKENQRLILSHMFVFENNLNFGGRKLVPNANMIETNFSVYHELKLNKLMNWENGLGAGYKWIQSLYTPTVNSEEKDIAPFQKHSPYANIFSGISLNKGNWHLKSNVSTGIRVPNLAELSSNGLHEGIYVYEIGNPLLKNEQLVSGNIQFQLATKTIKLAISPFYNHFNNYIYLAPSNLKWMALYPKWFYLQQNAIQWGGEIGVQLTLKEHWLLASNFSKMESKTADGNFTPYTPANKLNNSLTYIISIHNKYSIEVFVENDIVQQQNQVFSHFIGTTGYTEIGSKSYTLWNSGVSVKWNKLEWALIGKNLTNVAYFDNLSRFKNYNLLNVGRNLCTTFKWTF